MTKLKSVLATNVAVQKHASQFNENPGGSGIWPASLAVDGQKVCDRVDDTTVTLSGYDNYPWWQVDLGAVYDVTRINVYGRGDNTGYGTCAH